MPFIRVVFSSKLPEAYAFLNPIVDVMPIILVFFYFLSFCLTSCCKFFDES